MQRFTPMLSYDDAAAALDFLADAFGFQEVTRMQMPDGTIGHAEMALGDQVIMLANSWDASGMVGPLRLSGVHSYIYCLVDDVDAHHTRARAAGAVVIGEPAEAHGDRAYRAADPEGHHWVFATHTAEAPVQAITPRLYYDDPAAALDFLHTAFGFEETFRKVSPDGGVVHAEVALPRQILTLAPSWEAAGITSPLHLDGIHGQIYCIVDDIDAHYARAKAGGAIVVGSPAESHGARAYRAMDPEGHHWIFATPHTNEEQAS